MLNGLDKILSMLVTIAIYGIYAKIAFQKRIFNKNVGV